MKHSAFMTCVLILWSSSASFAEEMTRKVVISAWKPDYDIIMEYEMDRRFGIHYKDSEIMIPGEDFDRSSKIKTPGNYIYAPAFSSNPFQLKKKYRDQVWEDINEILSAKYFSDDILNYISEYDSVLSDTSRFEFYGRMMINDSYFIIGGWFGKFTTISVCTRFQRDQFALDHSVVFLNTAHEYFKIADLPASYVVDEDGGSSFLSIVDHKTMIWLTGFNIDLLDRDNHEDKIRTDIIHIVKYYDSDFIP